MAHYSTPKIVTDGLIMYLDAANNKSLLSSVEVLVVGGGGGGGMDMGGGGGGGGVVYSQSYAVYPSQAIAVTVGAGGWGAPAPGTNRGDGVGPQNGSHPYNVSATGGGNSVFGTITANGGGYGASSYWGYTPNYGYGQNGGCGGGASGYSDGTGNGGVAGAGGRYGNGTAGQGYRGGGGTGQYYSGGGGGAGGIGGEGTFANAPVGGPGLRCDILGYPLYWGGGGGGAGYSTYGGSGGIGGGGGGAVGPSNNVGGSGYNNGGDGLAGCTNCWAQVRGGDGGAYTGGGGGGGSHYNSTNQGGNGGKGIVIVKYPGAQKATGGDAIITQAGNTIHVFLNSGTFTVGTTWKDLCGNYDGTITGTTNTFSSDGGGSFVCAGDASKLVTTALNLSSGTYTIMAATKYTGGTSGRIITSTGNNWLMGNYGGNIFAHYAEGWVHSPAGGTQTYWVISTATGNSVSDNWKYYGNNTLYADNNGGSQGPNNLGINVYGGERSDGRCGFLMAYNRVLSADEIQQNFAALRGRYGI
jgi:hypothetical protein